MTQRQRLPNRRLAETVRGRGFGNRAIGESLGPALDLIAEGER
jgi:hypothetical protein